MAAHLAERHSLEFRPHPELTESERSPWLRRLSTEPRAWKPAGAQDTSHRPHFSNIAFGAVGSAVGIAVLAIAVWHATRRGPALPFSSQPLARLALAAVIGLVVTAVHKRVRGRTVGYSLARAQTLLCVAGALTMILIDNSVARAFGIAGAASIVRFRTPVEDPTDATVLFLLMALGMASGVGAFDLSVAGAAAVCLLLMAFGTLAPEPKRRHVTIELVGTGHDFPTLHVQRVFARYGVVLEPSEWSQDTATRVKYRASVDETLPLETLGAELMNRGETALQSVTWEVRKNGT